MKKLMVMLGVAAVAVASQAGSIKWSESNLKDNDGTAILDKSVTLYTFDLTSDLTAYNYMVQYATDNGIAAAQEYLYNNVSFDGDSSTIKINGVDYNMWGAAKTSDDEGGIASATKSAVANTQYSAATVFVWDDDGDTYYKANIGEYYSSGTGSKTTSAMATTWLGSTNGTTGLGDWQAAAVPEPTSGLLLLLGVAGLALRRRRA